MSETQPEGKKKPGWANQREANTSFEPLTTGAFRTTEPDDNSSMIARTKPSTSPKHQLFTQSAMRISESDFGGK